MQIQDILKKAIEMDAADIFIVAGLPVTFKCHGHQERMNGDRMLPDNIAVLVDEIYEVSRRDRINLDRGADDDFSFSLSQLGRFRVNVFRQRGSLAAVIRVIHFGLPDPAKLGIPETVLSLVENKKGLVLITAATATSLQWKTRSNIFTGMTNRLLPRGRFPLIHRVIWKPCGRHCARVPMSSCLER